MVVGEAPRSLSGGSHSSRVEVMAASAVPAADVSVSSGTRQLRLRLPSNILNANAPSSLSAVLLVSVYKQSPMSLFASSSAVRGGAVSIDFREHTALQTRIPMASLSQGVVFSLSLSIAERGGPVVVDANSSVSSNVPECVRWVAASSTWSSAECSTSFTNDMVTCACSHLSMFAVRMNPSVACGQSNGASCPLVPSTPGGGDADAAGDDGMGGAIGGSIGGVVVVGAVVMIWYSRKKKHGARGVGRRFTTAQMSRRQQPAAVSASPHASITVDSDIVHASPSALDPDVNPSPPGASVGIRAFAKPKQDAAGGCAAVGWQLTPATPDRTVPGDVASVGSPISVDMEAVSIGSVVSDDGSDSDADYY